MEAAPHPLAAPLGSYMHPVSLLPQPLLPPLLLPPRSPLLRCCLKVCGDCLSKWRLLVLRYCTAALGHAPRTAPAAAHGDHQRLE